MDTTINSIVMIILIVFGVVTLFIGVYLLAFRRVKIKQSEILDRQALKRNGKIKRILTDYNQLFFIYHNLNVLTYSNAPPHYQMIPAKTTLKISFNSISNSKIVIHRKFSSFTEYVLKDYGRGYWAIGLKKFELGDISFDSDFIVKVNEEGFALNFLNDILKNGLLELKNKDPFISLKRGVFIMIIPEVICEYEEYDKFVDTALMFCDRLIELGVIEQN